MTKKSGKTYALLLFIESLLVFSLGVFGNKVAERFVISTTLVITGTALLMSILFVLTLLRLRYEKGEEIVPNFPKHIIFRTTPTIFPIAIIWGMVIGFLCLSLLSGERFSLGFITVSNYEVISLIIALVLMFLIRSRNQQLPVLLVLAFGMAMGLAATFVFLRPSNNKPLWTFGGWIIEMVGFALLLNSNSFANFFATVRNALLPETINNKNLPIADAVTDDRRQSLIEAIHNETTAITVKILSPTDGERRPHPVSMKGEVSNLPVGHELWIVKEPHPSNFHPDTGPILIQGNKWIGTAFIGNRAHNADTGRQFKIHVVMCSHETGKKFQKYLENGHRTGGWVGLPIIFDGKIKASVVVVRDDSATISPHIEQIYSRHFSSVQGKSTLEYIYQQAGKIYDELYKINVASGLWNRLGEIDHDLIFFIAGWAKNHIDNPLIGQLTQEKLASGITEQLLAYLSTSERLNDRYMP